MALKKPFGALNKAYYGPTMVLKTINYFSQRYPQRSGVASDPDHLPQPQDERPNTRPLGWFWEMERRSRFQVAAPSVSSILAEGLPEAALDNAFRGVESEHPGSHFTHLRHRLDDRSVQFKVLVPYVTPGIEKSDRVTSTIYGCDIRAFVPVAKDAGVGKIANA